MRARIEKKEASLDPKQYGACRVIWLVELCKKNICITCIVQQIADNCNAAEEKKTLQCQPTLRGEKRHQFFLSQCYGEIDHTKGNYCVQNRCCWVIQTIKNALPLFEFKRMHIRFFQRSYFIWKNPARIWKTIMERNVLTLYSNISDLVSFAFQHKLSIM